MPYPIQSEALLCDARQGLGLIIYKQASLEDSHQDAGQPHASVGNLAALPVWILRSKAEHASKTAESTELQQ